MGDWGVLHFEVACVEGFDDLIWGITLDRSHRYRCSGDTQRFGDKAKCGLLFLFQILILLVRSGWSRWWRSVW